MSGFADWPLYPWLKALHIIARHRLDGRACSICRGSLSITPSAKPGSELSETFKVMERRLLRGIMNPAMIGGLDLRHSRSLTPAWSIGASGWFYAKLAAGRSPCSSPITAFARWRRQFAADANRHGARFYRIANEVPTAAADRHRDSGRGETVLAAAVHCLHDGIACKFSI